MRLPTYRELRRFVEVEGWTDRDKASGKKKGDHHRYTLVTPMGKALFTRISHGSGQVQNPDLFAHILRDQLHVTAEQFWEAVDRSNPPKRPSPSPAVAGGGPALDGKLIWNLLKKVGLSQEDVAKLSQDEAVEIWQKWLTDGGQ